MMRQINPFETREAQQDDQFHQLYQSLRQIRREVARLPNQQPDLLPGLAPTHRRGARNLLHYLGLRRHDLRPLQTQLVELGITSLGQVEANVLPALDNVLYLLKLLQNRASPALSRRRFRFAQARARLLLQRHARLLFGPVPDGRDVRIMVTLPSEAAHDAELIYRLLQAGMNCARINCAHDDPVTWSAMIAHLKAARRQLGKPCQIMMDLAGPKLRTTAIEPGPQVLRVRPERNELGQVLHPAVVWLTANCQLYPAPSPVAATLTVAADWLALLKRQSVIQFSDARGANRSASVIEVRPHGVAIALQKTCYFTPETRLSLVRDESDDVGSDFDSLVGNIPVLPSSITLHQGDILLLTRPDIPGQAAVYDRDGHVRSPARIGCSIPEIFQDVQVGEPIWLDDGKLGGRIEQVEPHQLTVRMLHVHPKGEKIRADKGINLPESTLHLSSLTEADLHYLPFVVANADVVELSFANSAADVEFYHEQVARLTAKAPGLILKIETQRAFAHLPELMFAAMKNPRCGIMIARGDLAVECGFERLAEVQEEILWLCEAARLPVVWATQVLETLAKSGLPSRAEITDAAMGHRAECVMLNKGPYVLDAVNALDDILHRMQQHQSKKLSMLRELQVAHLGNKKKA